ncbi:MAG TPA: autotransporter outer membrane beta-barrel domain-containing protein [Gammaproteobacteria bacterium]|nr:autotransporter outer membrane beta-barrel domain-containing protein [Gammaproteobacteria bacterium]
MKASDRATLPGAGSRAALSGSRAALSGSRAPLSGSSAALSTLGVCCLLAAGTARAQSDGEQGPPPGPGLVSGGLVYANDVERAAATANDLVFRTLNADCNPGGVLDQIPSPTYSDLSGARAGGPGPGPLCTPDAFFVYLNARELVHTANELQGQGPTIASLGLDQEGLGLALRWTAAEELAAQGSMATQFANSQLSTLAARLTALSFGAAGFTTTGLYDWRGVRSPLLAQAGDDAAVAQTGAGERYSPWGGFLNYGFGYGSKAPTALEDAFDFDGSEFTLGADYRLPGNIVLGGIVGSTRQNIDFDPAASEISVVDGNVTSDGRSFMVFALKQGERMTLSGSVGVQSLDYVIDRNIQYPSFNPNEDSIYSLARSKPDADVVTATFGFGYAFTWSKFTLEPTFDVESLDVTIGAFAEQRSINLLSNAAESRRFDLVVSEQDVKSLRTSLGLRFQYVVTPRFGVVVPYWNVALHDEHKNGSRTISSGYAALENVLGRSTFNLPTDPADDSYLTASAGVSLVLRGGRQREAGGPIAGGLSGFFQYGTVKNRENYEDHVMTAGFRYEF